MPTAKPRLQVTLTRPQYDLLKRLAKLQGRSASSVVAELFEQVYPVLERVAVVLQAAARAQESAKDGLRLSTEQAERDLRPVVAQALGQLDLLQADFERAAEPARAPAAGRRGLSTPVAVTRGSGMRGTRTPGTPRRSPPKPKSRNRRAKR
jgi:hypothetical protein